MFIAELAKRQIKEKILFFVSFFPPAQKQFDCAATEVITAYSWTVQPSHTDPILNT